MLVRASLFAFACLCIACGPGDITGPGGPGDDDVAAGDAPDAAAAEPGPDAAQVACAAPVTAVGSGEHNAGQACIACHAGNAGPDFTIAGTLYNAATGGAALSGGTITITDANGVTIDVVSQANGNFYSSAALAFPITIAASRCPDAAQMSATAAQGDCNAGGCHVATGSPGRVHLP